MPKAIREAVVKIIANKFYIWFITLALVVISAIWLYQMEGSGVLWARCTGGVAVLPLAGILRLLVKTKKDNTDDQNKLDRMKERHNYKLEKLKIKHGIPKQEK